MKTILKKIPLYESFDFNTEEDENFDSIIESHRYKKFLKDNYDIKGAQVRPYKKDGILFIDIDGDVIVKNLIIKSLTNGQFQFGEVKGNFDCHSCDSLKTLEGAPSKVGMDFDCHECKSLISLEGAPRKVGWSFSCEKCTSLISLEGAPREVVGSFTCRGCHSLKSIDLPATTKIFGTIYK